MGGQGVSWLSTIIRKATGLKYGSFTGSDNRGGAQRFGHVSSIIRFNTENNSANLMGIAIDIPDGQADFVISLEGSEALNFNSKISSDTRVFINSYLLAPTNIRREDKDFFKLPDLERHYRGLTQHVMISDYNKMAIDSTGAVVNANIFMLAHFLHNCSGLFELFDFENIIGKKRFEILNIAYNKAFV